MIEYPSKIQTANTYPCPECCEPHKPILLVSVIGEAFIDMEVKCTDCGHEYTIQYDLGSQS